MQQALQKQDDLQAKVLSCCKAQDDVASQEHVDQIDGKLYNLQCLVKYLRQEDERNNYKSNLKSYDVESWNQLFGGRECRSSRDMDQRYFSKLPHKLNNEACNSGELCME